MVKTVVPSTSVDAVPFNSEHAQFNSRPSLAERQSAMRARAEELADTNRVNPELRAYKVEDLMVLHNLSRQSVIRLYEHEPEVEILPEIPRPPRRSCTGRRCRTIRVPKHVYVRVRKLRPSPAPGS